MEGVTDSRVTATISIMSDMSQFFGHIMVVHVWSCLYHLVYTVSEFKVCICPADLGPQHWPTFAGLSLASLESLASLASLATKL